MEADGAERRVKELWNDVTYDAYVAQFISDDDSTMQARLKWPCAEALEAGLIPKWPMYVKRKGKVTKTKCAGTLTISHPAITNRANKNHRIRGYGSKMFGLAVAAKSESTMKKPDARRLQLNLSYAVHMNCDKSMDDLQEGNESCVRAHVQQPRTLWTLVELLSEDRRQKNKNAGGDLNARCLTLGCTSKL
jgi:hypothetical protein